MTDDPWAAFRSPKETSDDPWASFRSKPTENQTPEQKTQDLSTIEKGVRAASYGLLGGAEGAMNTIGKAIGADPQKLAKVNMLINAGKEAMGVTPDQYVPASEGAMNQKASFGERMSYMPRALIEMGAPMAAGAALGGLPGAVGTVGLTEAGPTIDRVREADKTDPNADLSAGQKARVAGKVGLDMLLAGVGGKTTLGAAAPVMDVGLKGVKQAAGNVLRAGATDAALGGGAAAGDKVLVEGEAPSFNDVAVPALTGALIGAAAHAPKAAKEATVATRFRALGDLDPQSRGEVADILKRYEGSFDATRERLDKDLGSASKGLDDVTKEIITDSKIKLKNGQRLDPEDIAAVTQASPEAGRVLQNMDTFGVMRSLDNGGVSNSFLGRILNPFERTSHDTSGDRFASAIGRAGQYASIGHSMWQHSPETALGVFGTQLAGTAALHGIDRFTGASNPGKVITDKFAGTANPAPSIAEARASALAKDVANRQGVAQTAKEQAAAARNERDMTNLDIGIGNVARKNVEQAVKARKAESDRLMREAAVSVKALNKRDDLQSNFETAEQKAQDDALRRQVDLMRNSQAVEERRLASEDRASANSTRQAWKDAADSVRALANRDAIEARGPAGRGQDMGVDANVPLPELVSSDAGMALKAARMKQLLEQQAQTTETKRQNTVLTNLARQLEILKNSESASSTSADLPLRVAKLKAGYEAEAVKAAEPSAPEPTFSSLAGTETGKLLEQARATERFNKKQEAAAAAESRKAQKATNDAAIAKAEKRVADTEAKAKSAEKDADPNVYVFEHRGQKIRVPKELVGNPNTYKISFAEKTDRRMDVLDGAKRLTKNKDVLKLLDQLGNDWTDTTNNPDLAYGHMERIANKPNVPKAVTEYLLDNWHRVEGTWATARRDIEND